MPNYRKFNGNLVTQDDVTLTGHCLGNVDCRELTLTENSLVDGTIKAKKVLIAGKVVGDVHATSVRLLHTGHVKGEIYSSDVVIAEGAIFEGSLHKN
ncbi:MAG: polymer-forming cytoskeletal protein [Alphaproteobacteria bacterium]|jgi:cytoskeletal protein CcmA (bactofilin family)|nr:polymer-forming cytoskeletal protein [Alphaproteobacteria bacterium]